MTGAAGRVTGVRIVAADAERLAAFYAAAFGFVRVPPRDEDGAAAGRLLGLDRATVAAIRLHLGAQEIELLTVDPPGHAYPATAGTADTVFQHIAIVVTDMAAATARLAAAGGATAISVGGPQVLPAASGGVAAYKFRDPEGHPLEFLRFPPGQVPAAWTQQGASPCLGFDHSAIVVADTAASVAFYAGLGFGRSGGSLNVGPEQERLDAVPGARVEVTALGPLDVPPHIELLSYRGGTARTQTAPNDVAATQIALTVSDADLSATVAALARHLVSPGIVEVGGGVTAALLRDPDGHRLYLRTPG